jgi:hypothetical protein
MVLAAIFSNDHWTFWNVFLLFFIWIPLIMLWFYSMIDIFGRRDLSGWGKALWLLFIVIFPWIGVIAYLIFRPREEAYGYYSGYGYPGAGRQPYGPGPTVID